jgi:hypothetical protein
MDFQEKEAIVRSSIDGWNSEDWEQGLGAIWHPDGVIVPPEGWPEAGTRVGWKAMVEQWRRIKDSWAEEHVELVSAHPAGEGVLAEIHWTLRGEASGAPLEVPAWILCEFEGSLLSKMTYFLDRESAQTAAARADVGAGSDPADAE